MRLRWLILTAFLAVFLVPLSIFADGTLDFVIPLINTGTLSYGGGSSPLLGQNIQVSTVLGYGGTQNNFDLVGLADGVLDFSSGNSTGSWTWGSGGSLTLTGTVGSFSGTLLQGTFSDAYLQPGLLGFDLTLGDFSGSISSSLSAFYGFPSASVDGSFGILTYIGAPGGRAFNGASLIGGSVQAQTVDPVDAVEGGGLPSTLCLVLLAGLCFAVGARLKVLELVT